MMKNLLLLLFFVTSGVLFAQDYNMQNGTITTCSGNFYDAGGPSANYSNNQDFTMVIEPATTGQGIRLNFTSFALESATWDNLKIYDGPSITSQPIGTFGGSVSPGIVETSFSNTSGKMTLVFHSDSSVNYAGWVATIECFTPVYQEQYIISNGGSATTCSGVFYDAGGPGGNYVSNSNLTYTINPATVGQSVQLDFVSFNLETSYDRLYVYDGTNDTAPILTILSGTYTTLPVITASAANTSGSLTFKFISDSSVNYSGWKANISCVTPPTPPTDVYLMQNGSFSTCGGTFYDPYGEFGYYNNNMTDTMTFCSSQPNQAVRFIFESFNLASGDILSVFDGDSPSSPLIGNFTGTNLPNHIQASYENPTGCLTFVFTSNATTIRQGWKASIECFIPTIDGQIQFSGCSSLTVNDDNNVGCAGGPCVDLIANVNFSVVAGGADTSTYNIVNADCMPEILPGTPVSVNIDDTWSNAINITFPFSFFGTTYNQLLIGSNGLLTFDITDAGGYCDWSFTAMAPSSDLPLNAIYGAYHDIDPSVCGQITYYITGTAPYRQFVVSFDDICHFGCNSLITKQHIVLYETSNIIDVIIDYKPTCTSWNQGNALIGIQNADGTIAFVPEGRNTGPWTAINEQWRFVPDGDLDVPYTFSWQDVNDVVLSNSLVHTVCPTETTTYTAHLEYTINGTDYVKDEDVTITYTGLSSVTANHPDQLETCFKDGAAVFDLGLAESQIVGSQTDVTVTYYASEADADGAINAFNDDQIHFFAVSDDYMVWVRVDSNLDDCYALTTLQLHIVPEDEYPLTQPGDLTVCADNLNSSIGTFDLTTQTAVINSGIPANVVTYYLTQADAETGTAAIYNTSSYNNATDPQTIYARLENPFGCYNTTSFQLIVNELPTISETLSQSSCNLGNNTATFTLEDIGVYDTTYYISQDDANAGNSNFIDTSVAYTSAASTIYARLENDVTGCYYVYPYTLGIYALPIANTATHLPVCNIHDGFGIFDLAALIPTIINGNTGTVSTTFYLNQADADTGSNSIANLNEFISVSRIIFVRVENENDCFLTNNFNLTVHNCVPEMPNAFSPNGDDVNDLYLVNGLKNVFKDFKFTVFNRWGNEVYNANNSTIKYNDSSSNLADCVLWDGKVDGIISSDPEGSTYYYILEFNDGENGPIKSWIYMNP